MLLAGVFFIVTIVFRNFTEGTSRLFGGAKAEIFQDPQVYRLVMDKLRAYVGATSFLFAVIAFILAFVHPPEEVYLWTVAGFLIVVVSSQMKALGEGKKLFMELYPKGKFAAKKAKKKDKKKEQASEKNDG